MQRSTRSIRSKAAFAVITVMMGIPFLGGAAASADGGTVQERAQAEMSRGLDYSAAWQLAARASAPASSKEQAARSKTAEDELNRGKDYVAAWEASGHAETWTQAPEQVARARRIVTELNEGKDYVGAWEASDAGLRSLR